MGSETTDFPKSGRSAKCTILVPGELVASATTGIGVRGEAATFLFGSAVC